MEIFVSRNGETLGPYSPDQLREMQGKGVVFPMDLVWIEGAEEWRPLYQVPNLFQRATKTEEPAAVRPIRQERSTVATVIEEDIALFAGRRHKHYVKVWNNGSVRFSFNAGVFLLSCFWFLYRRLYWQGAVAFVASCGSVLIGGRILPLAGNLKALYVLPFAILVGLVGDRLYLHNAERRIKAIKEKYREGAAQKEFIRRAGGTNLWWAVVGVLVLIVPDAYRGYKAGVESVQGPTVTPTTALTSPKSTDAPTPAPPQQEDELLVAIRKALNLTDVKEVADMPADYVGTRVIVAMQPDQGEPTYPPKGVAWQVDISRKSLRWRDAFTMFDAIFVAKKNDVPCVVALTHSDATYIFAKLDGSPNALGATRYFEAIGKDNKSVKILLR
ncbi:MAG: GYF domain-containing protein [Chthoniobacter sp.]|uniref:GYF domain-containing protein n=1 Tax=Chthoniobacter sp. TaxID=2510640 RepID=UPI0032A467E4